MDVWTDCMYIVVRLTAGMQSRHHSRFCHVPILTFSAQLWPALSNRMPLALPAAAAADAALVVFASAPFIQPYMHRLRNH
jgi:hypothetical protein